MHKTQQLIMFAGGLFILCMALYPPWVFVDEQKTAHPMGYAPIWKPPVDRQQNSAEFLGLKFNLDVQTQKANNVDLMRLIVQIAIVSAVTAAGVALARRLPA